MKDEEICKIVCGESRTSKKRVKGCALYPCETFKFCQAAAEASVRAEHQAKCIYCESNGFDLAMRAKKSGWDDCMKFQQAKTAAWVQEIEGYFDGCITGRVASCIRSDNWQSLKAKILSEVQS